MVSPRIIFILCVSCCQVISASYFAISTPFATAHPGDSVSLSWEVTNWRTHGGRLSVHLSVEPLFECSWHRSSDFRCDISDERSHLITVPQRPTDGPSSKRNLRAVGFILRDVTLRDAGVYMIDINYRGQQMRGNSTGIVYVFQKPSPPMITLLGGPNDAILVCNSTSNSRPSADENLVSINYSWNVTGIQGGYVQDGNTLTVDTAQIGPGSMVSCFAREENSRYTSDTKTAILVPLSSQSTESVVNKPAAGLGTVLVLTLTACIVVAYLWWSGTCKRSVTSVATNESGNVTPDRVLPDEDDSRNQEVDYTHMRPPEYVTAEDLQYEALDADSGAGQGVRNADLVYENM